MGQRKGKQPMGYSKRGGTIRTTTNGDNMEARATTVDQRGCRTGENFLERGGDLRLQCHPRARLQGCPLGFPTTGWQEPDGHLRATAHLRAGSLQQMGTKLIWKLFSVVTSGSTVCCPGPSISIASGIMNLVCKLYQYERQIQPKFEKSVKWLGKMGYNAIGKGQVS